ncbi:hypothetical protein YC2023_093151 [Brassica napus]
MKQRSKLKMKATLESAWVNHIQRQRNENMERNELMKSLNVKETTVSNGECKNTRRKPRREGRVTEDIFTVHR